ncbi:MAG: MFS transporter, partial [Chloroflexi bacterium]|nr:MFS transporter [Chloroflexota bacterium]
ISLTSVALVLTMNSMIGLVSSFIAGAIVDRVGRKGAMVASLAATSLTMLGLSLANTLPVWVALMAVNGAFAPLYRVGVDAMAADLIPSPNRPGAYALLRMSQNLGVAIGPALGGFVAAISYAWAFRGASMAQALYAILLLATVAETAPFRAARGAPEVGPARPAERFAGYERVLRDRRFMGFAVAYTLAGMCYAMMWMLLPVYAKDNFGVPENMYGFIPATNAVMVVLLQYGVTGLTRRYNALWVLAAGSLFFAVGVGSVGWGAGWAAFLVSMVIATIGELIVVPTSTTLTADLAPPEMRGRYMSLYNLTHSLGTGLGPVIGGLLNDNLAPVAIWYGGLTIGLLAVAGFIRLAWASPARAVPALSEAAEPPS